MKRLIPFLIVLVPSLALAQPPWHVRPFVIVNHAKWVDGVWTPQIEQAAVDAVNGDLPAFASYWFVPAKVYLDHAPKGAMPIEVIDNDTSGWAGEHGPEQIIVAVQQVIAFPTTMSATIDHEVKESLVDPRLMTTDNEGFPWGTLLIEVCDPVQDTYYAASNGQVLQDFVTPAWFNLPDIHNPPVYDFMQTLSTPLTFGPGGTPSWPN